MHFVKMIKNDILNIRLIFIEINKNLVLNMYYMFLVSLEK